MGQCGQRLGRRNHGALPAPAMGRDHALGFGGLDRLWGGAGAEVVGSASSFGLGPDGGSVFEVKSHVDVRVVNPGKPAPAAGAARGKARAVRRG